MFVCGKWLFVHKWGGGTTSVRQREKCVSFQVEGPPEVSAP